MSDKVVADDSWVFDSLVNFLHGNIWKIPVFGFIEEKSVVFDPDSYNNLTDDREDEFRKIHEEYKALVDFMLASFMEDIQVTPEQVETACQSRESERSHTESLITKVALEQLQAAEDFIVFRRLMTRKNIDLQLQSLEILVSKYGVLSPALRSQDAPESSGDNGEEDFLQVVIRYCDESGVFYTAPTNNSAKKTTSPTNVYLSSAIHKSFMQKPSPQKSPSLNQQHLVDDECKSLKKQADAQEEHENLSKPTCSFVTQAAQSLANPSLEMSKSKVNSNKGEAAKVITSQLINQEMAELGSAGDLAEPAVVHEPVVREERSNKGPKKSVKFNETTVAEIATNAPEQHRILTSVRKALDVNAENEPSQSLDLQYGGTEDEIRRRREYLSAQRDKLVALKKIERERQFAIHKGGESQSLRPKSARAAQMVLHSTPTPNSPDPTGKSLAARRALAERLKQELVEK